MTFVATQILVWIFLATVFGFILGWVVNSRRNSRAKKRVPGRRF